MKEWVLVCFTLAAGLAAGQGSPEGVAAPVRIFHTDVAPAIDGRLDENLWQQATVMGEFKSYVPDYGKEMTGRTVVYMASDDHNLYFAFRCFDDPAKVKASLTSRDNVRSDDWVCINLDAQNDHQTLYAFYVNPLGIQGDSRFAADREDPGFDLVWESAGRIDDQGYTIEIRIPTTSIRFRPGRQVFMGIIFERFISRKSEAGTYPPLSPQQDMAWLTQTMTVVYEGLGQSKVFELLPAATYSDRSLQSHGRMTSYEKGAEFSLTAKLGITPELVADAAYNPDFSQVEADAGQVDVNLRYDLFFPEKRPFFLEGSEHFNFAATALSELDPVQQIVHTRTIVDPRIGAKVTGKAGPHETVAGLYAMDELSDPTSGTGRFAHFGILRFKKSFRQDSFAGALLATREAGGGFNRVLGVDGQVRLTPNSLFAYGGLFSATRRDSAEKPLDGHSLGLKYRYGTRSFDAEAALRDIAKDFSLDMGYLTRNGIFQITALLRPKVFPSSLFFRRIDVEAFSGQTKDKFSGLWETFNHISLQHILRGNVIFKVKYSLSTEIYLGRRFQTGGFHFLLNGQFSKRLSGGILYRRVKGIYYTADPCQGYGGKLTASLLYQPTDKMQCDLSFLYHDLYRQSDGGILYRYPIGRLKMTYQLNKYLFIRAIGEYNQYRKQMLTDFLASFTYIPGTVIHLGYGSLYERTRWEQDRYVEDDRFLETRRGFFFKASYLWRM